MTEFIVAGILLFILIIASYSVGLYDGKIMSEKYFQSCAKEGKWYGRRGDVFVWLTKSEYERIVMINHGE